MPTITRITLQKRRENRRNVYLDGAFAFGCNLNVIARFRLREGLVLSPEQIGQIERGELRQECFDRAMRFLESRLHSRAEIARKLTREDYGPGVVEGVLEDLAGLGYLDDVRFSRVRAQVSLEQKRHGRRRAVMELLKAGVASDVAEQAAAEFYSPAAGQSAATAVASRHAQRLRRLDPVTARRRLAALLQRRGFSYEDVKHAIDHVLHETNPDP